MKYVGVSLINYMLLITGVDGLTAMMMVEPYSREEKGHGIGNAGMGIVQRNAGTSKEKPFNQMTAMEKVKKCCLDWNKKGCARTNTDCRWKHWCSKIIDASSNRVCWARDHGEANHK